MGLKMTVYEGDGVGVILSPCSAEGYYHIYAVEQWPAEDCIDRVPLTVGYMTFVPGEWYSRFGSNKKTSAAFIQYDGVPIQFVGTYLDNALFVRGDGPVEFEEFKQCYISWRFSRWHRFLLAITSASAARRMEMDIPPSGPSKFKPEEKNDENGI